MPDLRVVSEQSQADVAKRQAEAARERALALHAGTLRTVAANVLRIVRGAGKPEYLLDQMARCLASAEHFREVHGYYPGSDDIARILDFEGSEDRLWGRASTEDAKRWASDGTFLRARARDGICNGALQIVASTLLAQRTQLAAGEREMQEGVRMMEHAREDLRRSQLPPPKKKTGRAVSDAARWTPKI